MRQVCTAAMCAGLIFTVGGCLAVSAKDINTGMRYEAVAGADGKVFVVDTKRAIAWPVTVLDERPPEPEDDSHPE